MKNLFALLALAGIIFASAPTTVFAQEEGNQEMVEEVATDSLAEEAVEADSLALDSNAVAVEEIEEEPDVEEDPADPEEPTRELSPNC